MNDAAVMAWLAEQQDPRGIQHWQKLGAATAGLHSYGIGLTKLRQYAKQLGRNRALAQQLWQSQCHEAKVLALLIDDPTQISRAQAEQQVEQVGAGMLAHVFASCDATLAKAPFVMELANDWLSSEDPLRRECGYGLLYEISKFKPKKAPDDSYFLSQIARIDQQIAQQPERVQLAMATALMGIGKRNKVLNQAAIAVARAAGPIAFTSASGNCEPFDVLKHLTSERLQQQLQS